MSLAYVLTSMYVNRMSSVHIAKTVSLLIIQFNAVKSFSEN